MAITSTAETIMNGASGMNGENETKQHKPNHEMSISDIKEVFEEDFIDEVHDANKYCDMAKAAEEAGKMELAKGLYAISYDEYTHAKFIHDHLIDWGCEIPENEMVKWHELKERIRRKFRR